MRMDRVKVVLLCIIISMIGLTTNGTAEDNNDDKLCIPLNSITINPPEDVESKRNPVDFPHAAHFGINCIQCHHKWTGDQENLNCMTSGCHDLSFPPKNPTDATAYKYYKNAYHQSCIACHKRMKQKNLEMEMSQKSLSEKMMKTGPTGCVECHPKNEE